MQKTIRILAIVAAVLVALALLLLLISIPLQRMLATKIFLYPADIAHYLPIFPLTHFLECLLLLGCTILLAVCAGKKGIILPEILLLVVMIGVIPIIGGFLPEILTVLYAQFKGDIYVAAHALVLQIGNYFTVSATLGNALALVVAGMSIAYKRMNKKLAKTTE